MRRATDICHTLMCVVNDNDILSYMRWSFVPIEPTKCTHTNPKRWFPKSICRHILPTTSYHSPVPATDHTHNAHRSRIDVVVVAGGGRCNGVMSINHRTKSKKMIRIPFDFDMKNENGIHCTHARNQIIIIKLALDIDDEIDEKSVRCKCVLFMIVIVVAWVCLPVREIERKFIAF